MQFVYFTHSIVSCWNHGNAHFQRGLLRELAARGHRVRACEPLRGWSRRNLARETRNQAGEVRRLLPGVEMRSYRKAVDLSEMLADADVVIVHEWNEPALIAAIGQAKRRGAHFAALFHDTHHRAVSDPAAIRRMDLDGYDAVLAFGESVASVYRRLGWGRRAFVWHEAADTALFRPSESGGGRRRGLVWVGNWGDNERSAELESFLLRPARAAGLPLDIHGVRYPREAKAMLKRNGARYCGWLANHKVPKIFARRVATVHVPRRYYATILPGIPTIRIFEALACGIPLVSAPWEDSESLFRPGRDFLLARNEAEMTGALRDIAGNAALRRSLAAAGLESIRRRHSCGHRADELLAILEKIKPDLREAA